jgi:hypothetical protein
MLLLLLPAVWRPLLTASMLLCSVMLWMLRLHLWWLRPLWLLWLLWLLLTGHLMMVLLRPLLWMVLLLDLMRLPQWLSLMLLWRLLHLLLLAPGVVSLLLLLLLLPSRMTHLLVTLHHLLVHRWISISHTSRHTIQLWDGR